MLARHSTHRTKHCSHRRHGYSLIELMLAVAIVTTTMGLLFAAYVTVIDAQTRSLARVSDHALEMAALNDTPLHVPGASLASPAQEVGPIPDQYLIEFQQAVSDPAAEAQRLVAGYAGGKVLNVYNSPALKGCSAFIPAVTLDRLKVQPSVRNVEQDARGRFCLDMTPTGVRRIRSTNAGRRLKKLDPAAFGFPNVQGSLIRSTSVTNVVAMTDTGVEHTHPELNVTRRVRFDGEDEDIFGHGTFGAGIIGAKANGQGIVGVFPGVELWSLKVGDFTWDASVVVRALEFVLANASAVRVVNMPLLNSTGNRSIIMDNMIDACANNGVIMVCAGLSQGQSSSPQSASQVVGVAMLADSDGRFGGSGPVTSYGPDDTFASWSGLGRNSDGKIIAPGVDIISISAGIFGPGYRSSSGPSAACAHVSGLMAYYCNSVVLTPYGKHRRATGLEIVSLFLRVHGAELIRGPDGRDYPLLIEPSKRP